MSAEIPELIAPVSELGIANIAVYRKILATEALELSPDVNVILSEN